MLRRLGFTVLGWVGQLGLDWRLLPRGLRVLAYHGVHDAEPFDQQMKWLSQHFRAVGAPEAIEVANGAKEVSRAAWVTFDDGDPSVVDTALPILEEHGVRATLFVCPGLVGTTEPYWWDTVEAAASLGLEVDGRGVVSSDVAWLKSEPDPVRRAWVSKINEKMETVTGVPLHKQQITLEQLHRWVRAGHTVGNHSWDHPLLNQCKAESQGEQIFRAHEWLEGNGLMSTRLFAYPNGNSTLEAMDLLTDLGYEAALLFDHRIARANAGLNVSRLRVNWDDALPEYRARVTGVHTVAMAALRRSGADEASRRGR